MIGSSSVTVVLLTVVVTPLTVRLPSINAFVFTVRLPSTVTSSVNCETEFTVRVSVFALPTITLSVNVARSLNVELPWTVNVPVPCPLLPMIVLPLSKSIENCVCAASLLILNTSLSDCKIKES